MLFFTFLHWNAYFKIEIGEFSNFATFNISPPTLHTKLVKKENFSVFATLNPKSPNLARSYPRNWRRRRISPSSPISTVNPQLYTRNWPRRRISLSSPISTVNPPTLHTKLAKKENFSVFANFNRRPTNFTHEIGEEGESLRLRQFQPSIHQLYTRNWRRRRISPSSPSSPIWNLNSVNFRNEIGEEGGFLQIHGFHFYKWWRCWFQNKNLR